MDSSGYTPFIITDKDLEEEFNPSARSRRQTKEQATYGIWADEEEEELKVYKTRKPKSKYIGFISRGFNNDDKIPAKKNDVKNDKSQIDSEFASWERHTKGIGMKLLMKQGFKPGQGLGQSKQGISIPIAVTKTSTDSYTFTQSDLNPESVDRSRPSMAAWKKRRRYSAKPKLLTTEELMSTKRAKKYQSCHGDEVIDLTGPEARIYSDYRCFSEKTKTSCLSEKPQNSFFSSNELVHNLNVLVEMVETQIIENELAIQTEVADITDLEYQLGQIDKQTRADERERADLSQAVEIIGDCLQQKVPVSQLREMFCYLIECLPRLFVEYELARLATVFLGPMFAEEVGGDSILENPELGVDFMYYWRRFFHNEQILKAMSYLPRHETTHSPYDRLLCDVWLDRARVVIMDEWNVRDPKKMITLLDIWRPILPTWMTNYVIDNFVFPKILNAVKTWSPSAEYAHMWVAPWIGSGSLALTLRDAVLDRIGTFLTNWYPTDESAYYTILPWTDLIPNSHMETLFIKKILPKLSIMLQTSLVIDPNDQKLDVWLTFTQWHDVIAQRHMTDLIDLYFFPQFFQVLSDWLRGNPDYAELNKWYLGWKSTFPPKYLDSDVIKGKFREALSMMDCVYTARKDGSFNSRTPRQSRRYDSRKYLNVSPSVAPSTSSSLKDLVAVKAAENGIEFFPIRNKFINGKQVYRFGTAQLYVDRDVAYLFVRGKWRPESLDDIISRRMYMH